jgi:monoamine oxidase
MSSTEPLDVAVVGGGISGLYSAWHLLRTAPAGSTSSSTPPRTVEVFEAGARLGGRLLSPTPPGLPHLRAELGGMRYMSSQQRVSELIKALDLETDELPADEPGNLVYLRGTHLREFELTDSTKVPYQLSSFEQGVSPGALTGRALDQVLPRIGTLQGKDLELELETRQVDGAHLWEWGFWNLISLALSHEGFRFAQKGMGYDTALHNWNAADTIIMNADFSPGTKYLRVRDGYEAVPLELARRVEAAGGTISVHHRLVRFDTTDLSDGSTGVEMVFDVTGEDGVVHERVVRARHLILAMPRRSLELLDQTGAVLGPEQRDVHELIESVTPNPLFKAALCYEEPWWEATKTTTPDDNGTDPGPSMSGRAVTDLPIRQCYYWGVERDQPFGEASNNAMLLVYDDGQNVDFWEGFGTAASREAVMQAGADRGARWEDHAAPPAMVAELHRQIVELHDVRNAPMPYAVAYVDWGVDPYGGGVNFWNPGVKSWEVIPKVACPRPGLPVYIVGEAYSSAQGWVEGALDTAHHVLSTYFGIED